MAVAPAGPDRRRARRELGAEADRERATARVACRILLARRFEAAREVNTALMRLDELVRRWRDLGGAANDVMRMAGFRADVLFTGDSEDAAAFGAALVRLAPAVAAMVDVGTYQVGLDNPHLLSLSGADLARATRVRQRLDAA